MVSANNPETRLDSRLQRRRHTPRRRLGRRDHRDGRPVRVARRHPVDPAQRRPHLGVQLRFTDADGLRAGFLTNTGGGQLADLEVRHRRHARVEDRIRAAKDTGLRNRPFHDATQNQIWLEICALAADLIASTQRLACTGWAAEAEPKRLRLRPFAVAGRLVRTARRRILKICCSARTRSALPPRRGAPTPLSEPARAAADVLLADLRVREPTPR